ncbi:MAG: amidohydrolase [Firmicutes bacterium]|nr:amidohydrolase [Bacillota bacterium]
MASELYKKMAEYVDSRADWMVENRRDFHKFAEGGWHEVRTCSIIADFLTKLGVDKLILGKDCFVAEDRMGLPDQEELDRVYERALEQGAVPEFAPFFKDGFTGVEAVIDTGRPGPVVGFRTDIDALGVFESQDPATHRPAKEGFASINPGEMQACGHDSHATIGMMTAETIKKFKDQLCGKFKFVFQPSEEGVRGAKAMAGTGFLDDVDYMMAMHIAPLNPACPEEDFNFRYKTCMANAKLDVFLTGKACHAAAPESGNNAMLAAAAIILGIYGIPRASVGDARINVGQVIAGSGRNVVCDRVKMVMELRGLTAASLEYLEPYARRIIEHGAAMHGCTAEIKLMGATPAVVIDSPDFTDTLVEVANDIGFKALPAPQGTVATSDDYAYMADRVIQHGGKSCYISYRTDEAAPHHATTFDFANEKDMTKAVKIFLAGALKVAGL